MKTLKDLVSREDDKVLLSIHEEIAKRVVPETSCSQDYLRTVNKMINKGTLCINSTSYRRVYMPTLIKEVNAELASRYAKKVSMEGRPDENPEY